MEASTLIDPRVVAAVESVVGVVAHGPLEHGTFQTEENGRKVVRCRLYRNLDCNEHQATHEALTPYQPAGRFRIPFTVWIDPDGNKLFRRDGWRRPEEFLSDLRQALEKVPGPRRSKKDYVTAVKALDEGLAALGAQKLADAAGPLEEAAKTEIEEIRTEAKSRLDAMRARGETVLAEANELLKAGNPRKARIRLEIVARDYPSFECGRRAVETLQTLPK